MKKATIPMLNLHHHDPAPPLEDAQRCLVINGCIQAGSGTDSELYSIRSPG